MLRITMSSNGARGKHSVEIEGEEHEIELIKGMINGAQWVRNVPGDGVDAITAYIQAPPEPEVDWTMEPHWGDANAKLNHQQYLRFPVEKKPVKDSASIYVSHLRGYGKSDEEVERLEKLMRSTGFVCMRSRRGYDGKFWEHWYLAGPWMGKGPIETLKTTDQIVKWLCRFVCPGEIVVEGAHWGLSVD